MNTLEAQVSPATPPFAIDSLPTEVQNYITDNKLSFGKWYCGGGHPRQLINFELDPYWGWSLIFSTKVKYRCSLPFWWNEIEPPKQVVEVVELEIDNRKEVDAEYHHLKERHKSLCLKKLELMRKGKNTSIRNAYINQELQLLRSQLSAYRSY